MSPRVFLHLGTTVYRLWDSSSWRVIDTQQAYVCVSMSVHIRGFSLLHLSWEYQAGESTQSGLIFHEAIPFPLRHAKFLYPIILVSFWTTCPGCECPSQASLPLVVRIADPNKPSPLALTSNRVCLSHLISYLD